jgi:UDP-4-amino-4,6-dideoxy-N-acetyl-beta-L-altrosamine N-acetyltransferase
MYQRNNFTFRSIEEKDLNQIRCWRNRKDVRSAMLTDHIISKEEHQNWFVNIAGNNQCIYQIVTYRDVDIGLSNITEIKIKNETCSWGFYLGDPFARPGIGASVEYLSLDFIFETLQMRKVWVEVLISNQNALSMNKSFGFQEEGRLRAHVRKGEDFEDVIILSMFRSDWVKTKHNFEKLLFMKK